MKRIITTLVLVVSAIAIFAQQDVTTFLGIPVDGTKAAMKASLVEKGFEYDAQNDSFTGEFNGNDVRIYIATNNNKVYRLMICDENLQDEANIKVRFNKLVNQFQNNQRYVCLDDDFTIPQSEKISYEMLVNKKLYDAIFYQRPLESSNLMVGLFVMERLKSKYTEAQLDNPTEEIVDEMTELINNVKEGITRSKPVWFRISSYAGKYYISMFYDNERNKANGEDL